MSKVDLLLNLFADRCSMPFHLIMKPLEWEGRYKLVFAASPPSTQY